VLVVLEVLLVFAAVFASFAMQYVVFDERPNMPVPAYWIWFPPFAYFRPTRRVAAYKVLE
jgi:hypothetical protein